MSATVTISNHGKYALMNKQINLPGDTLKVLLMRNGFTFSAAVHGQKKNIKAATTAISSGHVVWAASGETITRSDAGSFITDGFVAGSQISITGAVNGANNAACVITGVTATALTCSGASFVNETSTASVTITADDELAAGYGYLKDTATLSGASLTQDNGNNRGDCTFANVTWTASGGTIGPAPGAVVYDSTDTDNTIVCYIDFGGAQSAPDGVQLVISGIEIRLS